MNIAHIEEQSYIYGPGCRFVIWTQGCSIRCKGCWNQSMWNFKRNILLSVEDIFEKVLEQGDLIEGITLLGGEPLDQFEETFMLLSRIKNTRFSTMLFTGYEISELYAKNRDGIFALTDILITGRYKQEERSMDAQWIGSRNQEIHFFSDRYKNYQIKDANYVEISIDESGACTILGFPNEFP
jgi:anaerobic ribonucleoside-triphosphate reductase activating protein